MKNEHRWGGCFNSVHLILFWHRLQNEAIPILASFLRKNHRALRLSTLQCLDIIVRNYGASMGHDLYAGVMKELPALINEGDLHVSQVRRFCFRLPAVSLAHTILG